MSSYFTRLDDRLWARVDKRGPSDCWPWQGPPTAQGYGQISVGGPELVHRVIYQLTKGEIPEGHHVDHTCHNEDLSCPGGKECPHRRCCNPAHLEAVTSAENLKRANGPRGRVNQNTHCPQNHEYNEANTMWIKKVRKGKTYDTRMCRTCNRERARARAARP